MSADSDRVYNKIRDMLLERGLRITLIEDGFQIPVDSTAVNLRVIAQEGRTIVSMYVPVLREVPASPQLFEYVAIDGQSFFFGHFRYLPKIDKGLLVFEHTLLGDYLDADELHGAVGALAITGNDLDDELQKRFGGKRFVDD